MSWRLRDSLALFALVVVVGVFGYCYIEGWTFLESLWMVVITLTSIGYGEVHTLSDQGRIFTIFLIMSGLSLGTYTIGQVSRYMVEGGFQRDFRERRRRNLMKEMSGHYIVAGYGRTGMEVAADLLHANQRVLVIDIDAKVCDACEALGIPAIHGDASDDEVLERAVLHRARGIAVASSSDAVNIFVTLSARQLNPKIKIMTRVDQEHAAKKAIKAGADGVVRPHALGGTNLANALLRPHSTTFMANAFARTHPDLSMEDVKVCEHSSLIGRLGQLAIRERFSVIVIAVQKSDGRVISAPGPEIEIEEGDVIVAVGKPEGIQEMACDGSFGSTH